MKSLYGVFKKTAGLFILHQVGAYIIGECMYKGEKLIDFGVKPIEIFISSYCDYGFRHYESFRMSSDRYANRRGGDASRAIGAK